MNKENISKELQKTIYNYALRPQNNSNKLVNDYKYIYDVIINASRLSGLINTTNFTDDQINLLQWQGKISYDESIVLSFTNSFVKGEIGYNLFNKVKSKAINKEMFIE